MKITLLSLILISSYIYAISDLEKKVQDLEKRIDEISTLTAMENLGVMTAKATPEVHGYKWYVTFEALWLHPKVGGTAFAYTNETPFVSLPLQGTTEDVEFNWHWGIRVGVGKQLRQEGWDVYFSYMHYFAGDANSTSGTSISTRIPLRGAIVTSNGVEIAKSHFIVHVNSLDLDLGRNYFISKNVSFRPYAGFKNVWVDLWQITRYTGGSLGNDTVKIWDSSCFWGLGLKFGVFSEWFLSHGVRIYSNLCGSFLYGLFDVDHKEMHSLNPLERLALRDNKHRFAPFASGALGIGWGRYIYEKTKYIEFDFGYEVQYYFRQNQMIQFYEYNAYRYNNISEDLSLHGLSLKARLDF